SAPFIARLIFIPMAAVAQGRPDGPPRSGRARRSLTRSLTNRGHRKSLPAKRSTRTLIVAAAPDRRGAVCVF
ncbi:MAG: hypothetical protein ACREEW_10390, partial [Caulobacteraceae bacterium]